MKRWDSDPGFRQLVAEHREGILGRREFLARLGAATAGAAATSLVGNARPASAQKKIVVTMWDTEPNPATRAAVKAIVEDFHKLHKDIEIQAEGMGWSDMDRKLQAAMAAKSPPTASHTQTYVVTSFRAKGLIEPIDDLVKAIGEDRIFPSVLRWLKYPDGKYWGLTHAWGADNLGGRGDYLVGTGVDPRSWKTWDDWLRDLPKLNKAPQYYGVSLAGIPFFVNEDVYMWTGPTAGASSTTRATPLWRARRSSGCSSSGRRSSRSCRPAGHRMTIWRRSLPGPPEGQHRSTCGAAQPATSTSTPRPTSGIPMSSRCGRRPSAPWGRHR